MNRWILLFCVAFIVFAVDQLTKEWVIYTLLPYESTAPVESLRDYFRFTHSHNSGAAFGIFPNAGDVFFVASILIVIALTFYYRTIPAHGWPTRFGIALIIGGALGNIIDRARHGHVTDFIHYSIPDVFSNVSNLADHAIVIGVIIIIVDSFRLERIERKAQAEASGDSAPIE